MPSETEQIEKGFSSAAETTRRAAASVAENLQSTARDAAEQQKSAGADKIGGVAHAMEAAADELHDEMPMAAEYIEEVSGRLGSVASALRERSADDMLGDIVDFARRQPGVFFAGAIAAGFAFSRFVKSSTNRGR